MNDSMNETTHSWRGHTVPGGGLSVGLGKILLSLFKNTGAPTEHKPSSGISVGLNFHEG